MTNFLRFIFDKQYRIKLTLIQKMKSKDNSVAVKAANTLRKHREEAHKKQGAISNDNLFVHMNARNWTNLSGEDLTGANLKGADLSDVGFNLKGANLSFANLQDANLEDTVLDESILHQANLVKAQMKETNLIGADLQGANLQEAYMNLIHMHGANLKKANLQKAFLVDARMREVNFENADLRGTKLRYANFTDSNLCNALLQGAEWDKSTILPDGTHYSNTINLECFTNPQHTDFWRPSHPVAWGGKDGVPKRQDLSALDLGQNDSY